MEKSFSTMEIKALYEERREIEGIASTPTVDRVGDIVEPTGLSFEREAPLLLNHDQKQPVGTVTFGQPTARGLPFKAKIAKVSEAGTVKDRTDEAWHSVKNGLIKGVSIGFIPQESKPLSNGGTRFTRASVHELSLTPIPANPDAVITAFKSVQPTDHKARMTRNTLADQIRKAVAMSHTEAVVASTVEGTHKAAVPAATIGNSPALYYPTQATGALLPPTTPPILSQLVALGAPQLPPNTRILTQSALLQASEIPEGSPYPGAAPSLDVTLTSRRKFGLILAFYNTLLAADNFSDAVVQYVQDQLEAAANNATDSFMVALMTEAGTTATSVAGAISAFAGDLRTAVWIGSPQTLATLQDAANPNVGPRGGVYKTLPAIPSLAVPAGKLLLQDVKRVTVFDGPQIVDRTGEANLVLDTDPANSTSAPVHLFQSSMTALKITKYADAKILAAPQVITLGA